MNGWLLSDLLVDLGLALLHSLWQVAAAAGALWGLLTLLHRASPQVRYALASLALSGALAWPTATFLQARAARAELQHAAATGPAPSIAAPAPRPRLPRAALRRVRPALPWLAGLWALGVLGLLLRMAGGWLWLRRLRRAADPAPESVRLLAARLARRMGLPLPDLRVGEGLGPFSYGVFRAVVVLPAACLAQLDPMALEAILAHEFAHLRRLDFLANGLQSLAEILLFHHPLARWISAAVRLERERCCDEAAAEVCGDARTVASALHRLEDLATPPLALAAQGAPLMIRLRHLLGRPLRPSFATSVTAALLLGGLGLAAAVPLWQVESPFVTAPAPLVRLADAAAAAEGVDPHLVRAMIQCESRFDPQARSRAGAVGLMQLMPSTAARFGVDRPEDPEENLRAGVKYLRFLLDRYQGDKAKAVVAYNAGEKALDRTEGIPPTEESRTYALAVLDLYRRRAVVAEGDRP